MMLLSRSGELSTIDLAIFITYMLAMLGVGIYFLLRNKSADDYYVGGRSMGSLHVGLSVVATDVGGGFSIGLGGLGFLMGLSGSWMLFTGLIGAWLAAVLLIPKIRWLTDDNPAFTFPQIFDRLYAPYVGFFAAIISGIGYIGFTSSQILAGAKLASASFVDLNLETALWMMGILIVIYTTIGGLKAVIFTDTIQWTILLLGLIFIGIPLGYSAIGGFEGIRAELGPEFLSLLNLDWQDAVNWMITILPIWFVGMTLYQRIYACRDRKTAQRAWYLAGLFEWPVMAFMGVALGLFARVAAEQGMFDYLGHPNAIGMDAELGLPMLLRTVLPVGLLGLMLSAYFSAILSTADSCLMASSGNFTSDLVNRLLRWEPGSRKFLLLSQGLTLSLGAIALLLASQMENVLSLMLNSYAFMVSGLLIPLVAGIFFRRRSSGGAVAAMLLGGVVTLVLTSAQFNVGEQASKTALLAEAEAHPALQNELRQKLDQDFQQPTQLDDLPADAIRKRVNNAAAEIKLTRLDWGSEPTTFVLPFRLDPNLFGITTALALYLLAVWRFPDPPSAESPSR